MQLCFGSNSLSSAAIAGRDEKHARNRMCEEQKLHGWAKAANTPPPKKKKYIRMQRLQNAYLKHKNYPSKRSTDVIQQPKEKQQKQSKIYRYLVLLAAFKN